MEIFFYSCNILSLIYFIILIKITIIKNECGKGNPFKKYNGICSSSCSKIEAENNKCILDNSIIKEQYLNNIIFLGEEGKSYFNYLSFSNGDFIFETYSSYNTKIFYGLKNNGRNYFYNEFYFLNSLNDEDYYNLHGTNSIFIKNEKEYFLNLDGNKYIEIYDFNQQRVFSKSLNTMLGFQNYIFLGSLIYLGNNAYIYFFSYEDVNFGKQAVIIKFTLNLDENNKINLIITNTTKICKNIYNNMISCFKTEKNGIIICFYIYEEYEKYYNIIAYTQDLVYLCKEQKKINHYYYDYYYYDIDSFIYSIAFKEDVGAFIYYKDYLPVIFFREYINNSFQNYYYDIEEIILNQFYFSSYREKNDFIKISNDKLGFFSVSENSETIYITIINFINKNESLFNNHVKIRYYSIELNILFHFKFNCNIKTHIFNNFIILGAGYSKEEICNNNYNCYTFSNFQNSLMIISYPNKTDSYLDIVDYIKKNKSPISYLMINLIENMTIDNNIFGYKYKGIKIHNVNKSGNIYLVSDNNEIIDNKINDKLYNSGNLNIKFIENSYIKSLYNLEYSIIVTESNFQKNEEYPFDIIEINGKENQEEFENNKK